MAVHPIEERYGNPRMRAVWEEENKWDKCLSVEAALALAQAELKIIPKKAADEIAKNANTKAVKVSRIKEIERETNHDIISMVRALSEKCGDSGRYVHFGATSNDITDTALALQLKESADIIEADLLEIKKALLKLAKEHKNTVCIGRTHGQHAIPTTYGLRFAVWASEVQRHLDRLDEIKARLLVGKMSGAVGTQAALGEKAVRIQELAMKNLGISPALVSTQVIQRDRHAEFLLFLALVAESLNKFGVNVRSWQRSELGEVSEKFEKGKQVGSSTMAHKKNPITLERVCGLSRVVKANAFAGLENVPLWDERDLTNSSCERVILPESLILSDYILGLTIKVLGNLEFNKENIERNLNLSGGLIMAERIMIELTKKGMPRQEAHELVRKISMQAKDFAKDLKESGEVSKYLSTQEIGALMDPHTYIGTAVEQVERVLREL